MRYIKKGEEPESFANWKALANEDWTPIYDELRGTVKTALHHSLLEEQGCVCCYCGMRIALETSHIEDISKISNLFPLNASSVRVCFASAIYFDDYMGFSGYRR